MNTKLIKNIVIVILAVLAALSVVQGCRNAIEYSQDFQYDAAKALVMGINPYDESLNPTGALDELGFDKYFKQMEANQFPSLLFLLLPYTWLTPLSARYCWLITNLLCSVLILILLKNTFFKEYGAKDFLIVALLCVSGTPWRNQIGVGQHTLFSTMFFLIAVNLILNKPIKNDLCNTVVCGLALSVSYFKYTLTVPLGLYFVYKRKWKELFISVVPHAILTVVAAIKLNDSVINMILKPLKVANALTSEGSMDIGALLGGGYMTMLLTLVLLCLLLIIVVLMPKDNDKIVICVLTLWSLIITYHRIYDHFVLIIPLCILLGFEFPEGKLERINYILLTLLVVADFYIMRILSSTGDVAGIVIVLYYFSTIYMTVQACIKIRNRNIS